jgi:hypothetical protein
MSNFWDEIYKKSEYYYGTKPNDFLKQFVEGQGFRGRMLFPGEGEGRNAVFAAKHGWTVEAFDSSVEARKKAMALAESEKVKIFYNSYSIEHFSVKNEYFNAAALIYVHIPSALRRELSLKLWESMTIGGKLVIEVFAKKHLLRNTFGPKDEKLLVSLEEIEKDFGCFRTEYVEAKTISLSEGIGHTGEADIIRFIGRK